MSTYRALKGYSVKKVDDDPSNVQEGQVWYNNTTNKLRLRQSIGGAWESGPSSNTLSEGPASFGNKGALVSVGGYGPSGPSNAHSDATEEWNGSSWSTGEAYPSTKYGGQGAGTLTAGLIAGGNQSGSTYLNTSNTYDGTDYSSAPNLNKARTGCASSIGTQTAALIHGGYDNSNPLAGQTETEEFNGTSWSEQNDLSTGRAHGGSGGTQTAGIYFCGESTNTGTFSTRCPNTTEEYNGTSWSSGGTVPGNFTRLNGSGPQTDCFRIGGASPSQAPSVDLYDGSSWSSASALGTAQGWASSGGTGSTSSIISRGRGSSSYTDITQLFSDPLVTTRSVDVS